MYFRKAWDNGDLEMIQWLYKKKISKDTREQCC